MDLVNRLPFSIVFCFHNIGPLDDMLKCHAFSKVYINNKYTIRMKSMIKDYDVYIGIDVDKKSYSWEHRFTI